MARKRQGNPDGETIKASYLAVKAAIADDAKGTLATDALRRMSLISLQFLDQSCDLVELRSLVPDKQYLSYDLCRGRGSITRPANAAYFISDGSLLDQLWEQWATNTISREDFARWSYTVALAPCLAMEIFDRGNKKGPATYFECFIAHLFSRELGVVPKKRATLPLPISGRTVRLTMDFIFELSDPSPNVHLAVKMSTRERIVQAWAHHRLLDAAYGTGEYLGAMVLFSETKLSLKNREVVEICVPDQWLAYQELLAKMDRIYYFDRPARYHELSTSHPKVISIEQFRQFFDDRQRFFPSEV